MAKNSTPYADKWREFLQFVDSFQSSTWLFRGHESEDYDFLPSVGRFKKYDLKREKRAFGLFKKKYFFASGYSGVLSELDMLVLAQHHGTPTRLLDWTSSPLVAAFFACQPVSVWVGNTNPPSDDGIIHAIKSEGSDYITEAETKRIFSLKSVRLVAPSYVADRVAAQRGFFTLHPKPNLAWNPISEGFKTKTFVVESKYKDYFVKRLFYVGVDNFALFKGLDGLGRQIKWQLDRGVELWRPI